MSLFLFACALGTSLFPLKEAVITERLFSCASSFEMKSSQQLCAVAERRFEIPTAFDLKDTEGELLAVATIRLVTPALFWGDIADIADGSGLCIGRIEEDFLRIGPWLSYRIFNQDDHWIATISFDIWQLFAEITHPEDPTLIYARLQRPYYRLARNDWLLEVLEEGAVDPRILLLFPVLQSYREIKERMKIF